MTVVLQSDPMEEFLNWSLKNGVSGAVIGLAFYFIRWCSSVEPPEDRTRWPAERSRLGGKTGR